MTTAAVCLPVPPVCHIEFATPSIPRSQFAFARIKGDVCLVQISLSDPNSSHSTVDVTLFRHEFITIFRYSHRDTVHPADIHVLELIDEDLTLYEEESGTVFLAKDLMHRLRTMTDKRGPPPPLSSQRQRLSSQMRNRTRRF